MVNHLNIKMLNQCQVDFFWHNYCKKYVRVVKIRGIKMKQDREKQLKSVSETPRPRGGFELWEHVQAARAQKVKAKGIAATDSMLAVYKDCLTYTFILDREVASIHFDRMRSEIFFKGHNINNIELTSRQMQALNDLKAVLAQDKRALPFLSDYSATLGRFLADKK